jgi:hypothetical protein
MVDLLSSTDVDIFMAKLFTAPLQPGAISAKGKNSFSIHVENDHANEVFHRPIKGRSSQKVRRDEMIVIKEIGQGASGRVFEALFCPTLAFLAFVQVCLFSRIQCPSL